MLLNESYRDLAKRSDQGNEIWRRQIQIFIPTITHHIKWSLLVRYCVRIVNIYFRKIFLLKCYLWLQCSQVWTVDCLLSDPAFLFNGGNQPTSSDHRRNQETVEEQSGTVRNISLSFRYHIYLLSFKESLISIN